MEDQNKIDKLVVDDTVYDTKLTKKFLNRKPYSQKNPKEIIAFIPGIIRDISVKTGQKVNEGDVLLILEAMKMKNSVVALCSGKIKDIKINTGDMVLKNQTLIEIE
jgi:biotin carboxyl carrier protein